MKEKLIKRIIGSAAALALVAGLAACGGERAIPAASTTISGTLQQGNIQGATVFLDLNGNGTQDAGEQGASAATGADGKFSLSLTASQVATLLANINAAKIVGKGGTDVSTGLPQGLLVADPPATEKFFAATAPTANVTPMTTLVAMTPAAQKEALKTVLASLGLKDSSGNVQVDKLIDGAPAAVVALAKSVETVLATLQTTVAVNGNEAVALDLVRTTAAEIGKALATKTAAELTNATTGTTAIADVLATAADTAIQQVDAASTNLTVTPAQLTIIKDAVKSKCKDVADAVKSQTGSLSTSGSTNEATVVAAVKTQILEAVNSLSSTIDSNSTVVKGSTDTTPPFVLLTTGSKTGNVLKPVITAEFSEPVSGVTTSTFTVKNSSGATVAGTVTAADSTNTKWTFTPTDNLTAGATYTATLSKSIKDAANNTMAADVTLTFSIASTATGATGGTGGAGGGTGISF